MAFFTIGRSKFPPPDPSLPTGSGLKHNPAFETYITKLDGNTVLALQSVTTREVDNEEIGDYSGARKLAMPDQQDLISPLQHCQSLEELMLAAQKHFTSPDTLRSISHSQAPIQTNLIAATYTPHDPIPTVNNNTSTSTQVHAAITFVNGLSGYLRLPDTFTLSIDQRINIHDIRHAILSKFEQDLPAASQAQLEEKYPHVPLMLHLWVMPQGLEHGKLYSWQSGPLEQFLSAAYIASNDRRLYLEAHLAPVIMADMKSMQCNNIVIQVDAYLSEGDDFDKGLLSLTDEEESQSDSDSIHTPSSETSNRGLHSTVQLNSLPPKLPNEEPQCAIVIDFDTSNLPLPNEEENHRKYHYTLPLSATPTILAAEVLQHACAVFRKSHNSMMLALKYSGKGIRMRSFTAFRDDRDSYLRRDRTNETRIARLSDLFHNRKILRTCPTIPITVKIDIIDLVEPGCTTEDFDSANYRPQNEYFAFHRIATAAPPNKSSKPRFLLTKPFFGPQEETLLKPLQTAHLIRYPRAFPLAGPVIGVSYREINGVVFGDTRDADEDPRKEEQVWVERYRKMNENMGERYRAAYRNAGREARLMEGVREGVPFLPTLTFLGYVGKGVRGMLGRGEKLHVAVEVVNSLEGSKVGVPVGVVVRVTDGEGMRGVICEALEVKLRGFYGVRGMGGGVKMVDLLGEGKLRWDLWVLPQRDVERKGQGEKVLYRFREGSLRVFLDEEMVKWGMRTLYMEAHIVGVE